MKTPKIYSIQYLIEAELTDEDLHNLFDKKSLLYSFIVSQFKEIGSNLSATDIIKLTKTAGWYNKFKWKESVKNEFCNKLAKAYYNIYRYGVDRCKIEAEWYITNYGFMCNKY